MGHGGVAFVYRAIDKRTRARVAIKLSEAGPAHLRAAATELMIARELGRHGCPRLIQIDIDQAFLLNDRIVLVMPFLRGTNLANLPFPQPPVTVVRIGQQICRALRDMHKRGIRHGDVKPENIFVRRKKLVRPRAVLHDLGTAEFFDPARPRYVGRTVVGGTEEYMAPEVLRGQARDGRADQYSLALTLYEELTGISLHDGIREASQAEILAILARDFSDLGLFLRGAEEQKAIRELGEILKRMKRELPDERYQDIREVEQAFGKWLTKYGKMRFEPM